MFFEPLTKGSRGFTNVFLIPLHPVTLISVDDPTFFLNGILIFWGHQEVFDCVASLEVNLHPIFTANFLHDLTDPLIVGDYYVRSLSVIVGAVVVYIIVSIGSSFCLHFCFVQCPCRVFTSFNASSMWCTFDLYSSLSEQVALALCCKEPITLHFDETWWLLSHWRYKSVCVGFLYTVVLRFPSSSGIIRTSRKGMEPSMPASSLVNCMWWSMLFRCSRKLVLCGDSMMVKVSSTNLPQNRGVWCCVDG